MVKYFIKGKLIMKQFMQQALNIALKGKLNVSPNPLVGCVIVKNNIIIGKSFHKQFGGWHAEKNAILSCSKNVENSELYVTLEPCCHYGKTPPCLDLILKKKIRKVIISNIDPNPLVNTQTINILRQNGVLVDVGLLQNEAKQMNKGFFSRIQQGRPWTTIYDTSLIKDYNNNLHQEIFRLKKYNDIIIQKENNHNLSFYFKYCYKFNNELFIMVKNENFISNDNNITNMNNTEDFLEFVKNANYVLVDSNLKNILLEQYLIDEINIFSDKLIEKIDDLLHINFFSQLKSYYISNIVKTNSFYKIVLKRT